MQERRVLGSGVDGVENRVENVVLDLDELGRPFGGALVSGHDGRHLLADEPDPVGGEGRSVLHIQAEAEGEVRSRHHLDHTGDRRRFRRVDAHDPGVGVGRLDDLGVEEVGPDVRELIIRSRFEGTDTHDATSPAAAASTASMIGSYPVQRQRLPASACWTSCRVGDGLSRSSS